MPDWELPSKLTRSPQTNGAVKFLPSTIATPQRTGD
jgi:hypothetical protein